MEKIADLMLKEHARINVMLIEFEKNVGDFKKAQELFSKFKWNLEKHFFVEEKAIFDISISLAEDEVSGIFDLMQDHGKIMTEIKGVESDLLKNNIPDISDLKTAIKKHVELEDNSFYPSLDLKLNENQKKVIIERTSEIILG